jgi:hypothetical protein
MTATLIAIPVATAIATETAAAPVAWATSAGSAAILTWLGFVDFQSATAEFLTVELLDSSRSFFVRSHLNKRESPRLAGVVVLNEVYGFHGARLTKQFLQILARGLEREISNIEFRCHRDIPFPSGSEKEAANRIGFGETVAVRRTGFGLLLSERLPEFETSLLSNHPKRPALILLARGASPSMRERRFNSHYDA